LGRKQNSKGPRRSQEFRGRFLPLTEHFGLKKTVHKTESQSYGQKRRSQPGMRPGRAGAEIVPGPGNPTQEQPSKIRVANEQPGFDNGAWFTDRFINCTQAAKTIMSDYDRIAKAISFVSDHVSDQPSLEEMAAHVHLSPFHFQRLFRRWAGTTPKRLLQILTLEHGKRLLDESRSLLEVSESVGLSSSSRLHDHFVQLEAVTPGQFKQKGKDLRIDYGVHATPFGSMFIAVTNRGICRAAFLEFNELNEQLTDLNNAWPLASLVNDEAATQGTIDTLFGATTTPARPLSLYVEGTNFQIAVWRALLQIPHGAVASYSQVADSIGSPRSSRAVGNAIGANPIALAIPCHRVIQQTGALGGYRWGPARKQAIQIWERTRIDPGNPSPVSDA
jgi:AraC family transcriptional regulator of adaptative response/methylated-DNA-[protein]-cysteine methyltransferase